MRFLYADLLYGGGLHQAEKESACTIFISKHANTLYPYCFMLLLPQNSDVFCSSVLFASAGLVPGAIFSMLRGEDSISFNCLIWPGIDKFSVYFYIIVYSAVKKLSYYNNTTAQLKCHV